MYIVHYANSSDFFSVSWSILKSFLAGMAQFSTFLIFNFTVYIVQWCFQMSSFLASLGWQCWWPSFWCSSTFTTPFRLIRQRYNLLCRKYATLSVKKKNFDKKYPKFGLLRYCESQEYYTERCPKWSFFGSKPTPLSHSTAILTPLSFGVILLSVLLELIRCWAVQYT